MDWAREFSLEDWAINLAHLRGGCFVFDSDDDAIGVKEILDGGAFAQEFGIGHNAESYRAVARVGVESAVQFEAGAGGHCAFFNDEF